MKREFEPIWKSLRGKKPSYGSFLNSVSIDGLRGLKDLTVRFGYPVSVIAGGNASGKSTVLFSLACAYQLLDKRESSNLRPAQVFPVLTPRAPNVSHDDRSSEATLVYSYQGSNEGYGYESDDKVVATQMLWRRRAKRWRNTFFGLNKAIQPPKEVYRRTLSDISSPTEKPSLLSIIRAHDTVEDPVDHELIQLAERVLPFKYEKIAKISSRRSTQSLLFAVQKDKTAYSEFQMSAGERAALNISQEVSELNKALVLIDEVEAGLHPYLQELLMLRLQELALRNELQIVVTTHSEAVINSVPRDARIFLARNLETEQVEVRPPYSDSIQNALYGRSHATITILCEDRIAEGVIRGAFDKLTPKIDVMIGNEVKIRRNTGAQQFRAHYEAVRTFGMHNSSLFVLDGDSKQDAENLRRAEGMQELPALPAVLNLPGDGGPEAWVWATLKQYPGEYEALFNLPPGRLLHLIRDREQLHESADTSKSAKSKAKFGDLCDTLGRPYAVLAREVARNEAAQDRGEMSSFVGDLELVLEQWHRND